MLFIVLHHVRGSQHTLYENNNDATKNPISFQFHSFLWRHCIWGFSAFLMSAQVLDVAHYLSYPKAIEWTKWKHTVYDSVLDLTCLFHILIAVVRIIVIWIILSKKMSEILLNGKSVCRRWYFGWELTFEVNFFHKLCHFSLKHDQICLTYMKFK